jgi:hypothetical protein
MPRMSMSPSLTTLVCSGGQPTATSGSFPRRRFATLPRVHQTPTEPHLTAGGPCRGDPSQT